MLSFKSVAPLFVTFFLILFISSDAKAPPSGTKDYRLIVEYSWPPNQKDLDSSIKLFGDREGHKCKGSKYITSLGDNTDDGGKEIYEVRIGEALIDRGRSTAYLEFNALWFNRISFATANLYMYMVDKNNRRIASSSPMFVHPAPSMEEGCASNIVATANIQLSPKPKIMVQQRVPTELYLIANFTMRSEEDSFVSAVQFGGETVGVNCKTSESKYIVATTSGKGRGRVDSYVLNISEAKKDRVVGSNSIARFNAGWTDLKNGPNARMTVFVEDGSGRRYPLRYHREKVFPGGNAEKCPSQLAATAFITYSSTRVRLGLTTT